MTTASNSPAASRRLSRVRKSSALEKISESVTATGAAEPWPRRRAIRCPRAANPSATAAPVAPVPMLDRNRTASIGSLRGPGGDENGQAVAFADQIGRRPSAVAETLADRSGGGFATPRGRRSLWPRVQLNRPGPSSPQACAALSELGRGSSHSMSAAAPAPPWSPDGTTFGRSSPAPAHHGFSLNSQARNRVPTGSSASPEARRFIVLAVAGQTSARSAARASSMWSRARPISQRSAKTGRPLRPPRWGRRQSGAPPARGRRLHRHAGLGTAA